MSRVRVLFAIVLDGLVGVLKVMCKESAVGGRENGCCWFCQGGQCHPLTE